MSTVYIIKDGIIVDSLIAASSYRDERGTTVKPVTKREEQELQQFSKNNEKIRELRQDLEELGEKGDFSELQAYLDAQLVKIQKERGEELRKKLLSVSLQNANLEKIGAIRKQAARLEELVFHVATSEGEEELEAQVDLRTRGDLARLLEQTEEISSAVLQGDGQELLELSKQLEQVEQELLSLPGKAKEVFTAQIWRQEQAGRVAEGLQAAAWQIVRVAEGDGLFDPLYMAVENAAGDKAVLTFSIQGDVSIDSKFSNDKLRSAFQQTVLGILVEGGAKGATGHCMDGEKERQGTLKKVRRLTEKEDRKAVLAQQEKERLQVPGK